MSILAVLERRLGGTGNFTWSSLEMSMQPVTTAPTAFHADLSEAIRRALETFARVSLGLILFIAGLDGFIDVLPHPSRPLPERAILFVGALLRSGYFFPMLKGAGAGCRSALPVEAPGFVGARRLGEGTQATSARSNGLFR